MPESTGFATIRTEIAGVSVTELARRFGTPLFVYDQERIVRRVADLAMFDRVRYAQKACSNLAILDLLRRRGVLVDAVSAGEVQRALRAGYAPDGTPPPIVYTADIFDAESLELCVQLNLHVNCGSPDMIEQWGQRAPGSGVTLRLNPGFGHGHSQKTNTGGEQSKHGIWHEQLGECLARAKQFDLTVTGLHMHIGSGTDLEHLSRVCAAMESAACEAGPSVASISAGGGLPVPYRDGEEYVDLDAYYQLWDAVRRRLEARFGHPVGLEIEPGRYLVAEAGYLIAEVRAVKQQADNTFYLVDAGFNNLARPILYGAYHPMAITPAGSDTERPQRDVIVGGPLCESGDIFTQEEGGFVCTRRLPDARVGDFLVIENVGAYGFVMGSNYNSKPLAAEVLLRGDGLHLIRRRQSFEELMHGESIPETDGAEW
ncbi:MAG: diaminopimelate decarboxylase [Thermoguttaceae bacterium]|jgi:diaminopimelate decarboxylase|nr:diaminopimelate decarboxylase [Thermoguttaceae bacterium]